MIPKTWFNLKGHLSSELLKCHLTIASKKNKILLGLLGRSQHVVLFIPCHDSPNQCKSLKTIFFKSENSQLVHQLGNEAFPDCNLNGDFKTRKDPQKCHLICLPEGRTHISYSRQAASLFSAHLRQCDKPNVMPTYLCPFLRAKSTLLASFIYLKISHLCSAHSRKQSNKLSKFSSIPHEESFRSCWLS